MWTLGQMWKHWQMWTLGKLGTIGPMRRNCQRKMEGGLVILEYLVAKLRQLGTLGQLYGEGAQQQIS